MLRAVGPEGALALNGTVYNVGALRQNSTFLGYVNRSALALHADPTALQFSHYTVGVPDAPFPWTPGTRHAPTQVAWPPKGVRFEAVFQGPAVPPVVPVAAATLSGKAGVRVQYVPLSTPLVARRWRLQINATYSQYQAILAEVQFCQSETQCIENNGTASQSVVTASSGWRPNPFFGGGAPWQAADGNTSSCWDSVADAATGMYTLDFAFARPIAVAGLNLTTLGDTTHDPKGMLLQALADSGLPKGLRVSLVYDLYDGIPLMTMQIRAGFLPGSPASAPTLVSSVNVTRLALMPPFGAYETSGSLLPGSDQEGSPSVAVPAPWLQAKTDQAHGASCEWTSDLSNRCVPASAAVPKWFAIFLLSCTFFFLFPFSIFFSFPPPPPFRRALNNRTCAQPHLLLPIASYNPNCDCEDFGAVEPILSCHSQSAGLYLRPGGSNFTSYRSLLLFNDDGDIERQSLARGRVTQLLAPHTMENPIFFHATDVVGAGFTTAVDRMQEVGFEMLIFSFGSGFNLENNSSAYLDAVAKQIAYANAKGIEVGGYDLISLDRGDLPSAFRQLNATGSPNGNACFASGWYDQLTKVRAWASRGGGGGQWSGDHGARCAGRSPAHAAASFLFSSTCFPSLFHPRSWPSTLLKRREHCGDLKDLGSDGSD